MKKHIFIFTLSLGFGFILGWHFNQKSSRIENINQYNAIPNEPIENQIKENHINDKNDYCDEIVSYNPLIVQYAKNAVCNCDSAYTNLEINYCSAVKACLVEKKFDSLNNLLIQIYDSLNIEQNEEINNRIVKGDSSMLEYVTNYKMIKNLHIESIVKYFEYADLETTIIGIKIGTGRLRTSYENYRRIEILGFKNLEINKLINEYQE